MHSLASGPPTLFSSVHRIGFQTFYIISDLPAPLMSAGGGLLLPDEWLFLTVLWCLSKVFDQFAFLHICPSHKTAVWSKIRPELKIYIHWQKEPTWPWISFAPAQEIICQFSPWLSNLHIGLFFLHKTVLIPSRVCVCVCVHVSVCVCVYKVPVDFVALSGR